MSTDGNSTSGDLQRKPMAGKYDGRKTNGRYKSAVKRGPKPLYLKHMSRNTAGKVLEEFDSIATWADIYKLALDAGKLEACIQMRVNAEHRLYGKPFVAENPEKASRSDALANDTRLQDAIKKLVPARSPAKAVM